MSLHLSLSTLIIYEEKPTKSFTTIVLLCRKKKSEHIMSGDLWP